MKGTAKSYQRYSITCNLKTFVFENFNLATHQIIIGSSKHDKFKKYGDTLLNNVKCTKILSIARKLNTETFLN